MLPSDCARRLVSLLTQALDDCTEQKQRLQQNVMRCQALLKDWNSDVSESAALEESKNDNQTSVESEPTAKELEELELLNKALEKALRVRTKYQQAPCQLIKGAKAADKTVVTSVPLNQQGDKPKESITKSGKVSSVICKPSFPKKPTAYMLKAPYRTDPDLKRPQVKTSARLSSRASVVPGKKSPKGTSPKAKLPVKITQLGHGKACVAKVLPGRSPSFGTSEGGGDSANADLSLPKREISLSDPSVKCSAAQTHVGRASLGMGTAPQVSTLQAKGSLLELPLPYKKAFSKYIRLLEKCQGCQTSPEATTAKNHFMEKLQATFCSPSPAFSPIEVRRELMDLKDVSCLMRQYMETETSGSLGENPTWEREYESLLTLEGLQTIAKEHLDKVQQLREAMESHAKLLPGNSVCGMGCSSKECPSLGKERCWDVETVGPPPLLFYSSLKELMDMETLKLKVAMLQQRLEIQKAMEAELLPLLEPGHLQEGSRALLYRSIYTLLCEGGENFPVLVNDVELSD
ncbi:tubulin epsilon and delta complex protein 2 isoform X2 [Sceloporus undulatus]|uniref:tubulin epsilon and delta complex protein 2 isoform X2 n=1 Tax=Sceloporus undulatus TaxID=8520 RepID=UPI001C4C0BE0|nr:tubulin epsilon and delta complex protein 2 isoform X2 [Sceloporus undulatus]